MHQEYVARLRLEAIKRSGDPPHLVARLKRRVRVGSGVLGLLETAVIRRLTACVGTVPLGNEIARRAKEIGAGLFGKHPRIGRARCEALEAFLNKVADFLRGSEAAQESREPRPLRNIHGRCAGADGFRRSICNPILRRKWVARGDNRGQYCAVVVVHASAFPRGAERRF